MTQTVYARTEMWWYFLDDWIYLRIKSLKKLGNNFCLDCKWFFKNRYKIKNREVQLQLLYFLVKGKLLPYWASWLKNCLSFFPKNILVMVTVVKVHISSCLVMANVKIEFINYFLAMAILIMVPLKMLKSRKKQFLTMATSL